MEKSNEIAVNVRGVVESEFVGFLHPMPIAGDPIKWRDIAVDYSEENLTVLQSTVYPTTVVL
jgi:hypothetical protein